MGKTQEKTDDIFFSFFPENRILHFMQIVSCGDNLHELSNPVSRKNKIFSSSHLLQILPSTLNVKEEYLTDKSWIYVFFFFSP